MRYTFFEFENFKGIREAQLELAPADSAARVYTLVGLNESGKTTVLEAIDHFQATTDDEVSPKEVGGWTPPDPHSLIPISERTNFNGEIIIRCGIELDDDDVAAASTRLRKDDGYRLSSLERSIIVADRYVYENSRFIRRTSSWTNLVGAGRTKKGRIERTLDHNADFARWNGLAAFLRTRMPTIWYFPNFLFDFPEKIYLEEDEEETASRKFYRTLFQDILDALPRDLDLRAHIIERARSDKSSDRENLQQVLLEASRHVTDTVVSSWNRIFRDNSIAQKQIRIDIGEDPDSRTDEIGRASCRERV